MAIQCPHSTILDPVLTVHPRVTPTDAFQPEEQLEWHEAYFTNERILPFNWHFSEPVYGVQASLQVPVNLIRAHMTCGGDHQALEFLQYDGLSGAAGRVRSRWTEQPLNVR